MSSSAWTAGSICKRSNPCAGASGSPAMRSTPIRASYTRQRKGLMIMALRFETNVSREVCLRDLEGVTAPSNFGADQVRFDTDQGSFYVSESVANVLRDQFRRYNVKPGEPIEIVKGECDLGRGRKAIRWEVSRVGFAPGEQRDGSFAVDAS